MEKIMASGKFVNKTTGRVMHSDADYVIGINENGTLVAFWSMLNEGDDIKITSEQAIADLTNFIQQDKELIESIQENTRVAGKILEILRAKKGR